MNKHTFKVSWTRLINKEVKRESLIVTAANTLKVCLWMQEHKPDIKKYAINPIETLVTKTIIKANERD